MALTTFLDRRGHWHDLIASLRTALAAAKRLGDPKATACARSTLGHAHISLGSYPDAIAHYEQALAVHRQLGDRAGQGRVHIGIGFCLSAQGRHREAIAHSTRALQLYLAAGPGHLRRAGQPLLPG
jgi:tetratricopeptide (TPR) repeat protein